MRRLCFSVLVFCFLDSYNAVSYRQERGEVTYYNPKYVSQAQAFTARRGRTETYTTNGTFTNLHAWSNNVTFKLTYKIMQRDIEFTWKQQMCEMIKYSWVAEYLKHYSDIQKCPIQKGRHRFYNLIFPPKDYPLPMPRGETSVAINVYITKTLENILDFSILINKLK